MRREALWQCLQKKCLTRMLLKIVSGMYGLLVILRKQLYRCGLLPVFRSKAYLIIVGNLSLGGNGKTPTVKALAELFCAQGFRVAIISRGYGRKTKGLYVLEQGSQAADAGDEPLLLFRQLNIPVVVAEKRAEALAYLEGTHQPDIIISDDGLSHYAIARDYEIILYQPNPSHDYLFPYGYLREPLSRLQSADYVSAPPPVIPEKMYHFATGKQVQLEAFQTVSIHAFAAIANPQRFVALLEAEGMQVTLHAYADHARIPPEHFYTVDGPIVITEKDAVKYETTELPDSVYVLAISVELPQNLSHNLMRQVTKLATRSRNDIPAIT